MLALIARYQPSHTEDDDVRTAYVWKYRTGQSQVLQQLLGKLAGIAPAKLPAPDDAEA